MSTAKETNRSSPASKWDRTSIGPDPGGDWLDATPAAGSEAILRRVGDMWEVGYAGRTAYVRDVKGLHDLAALLARPGVELTAIDLAGLPAASARPKSLSRRWIVRRSTRIGAASPSLPMTSPTRS
jgi:hypothetical protein